MQEAREQARGDEGRGEGGERELEDVRGCDWEWYERREGDRAKEEGGEDGEEEDTVRTCQG